MINLSLQYIIPYKFHNKTYPVFTFVETLFFAWFFYHILEKISLKKKVRIITMLFSAGLLIYYYYTYYVLALRLQLDSVPIGVETILIFLFSFFYFFEQMNDTTSLFIYSKPSFWAVLGILLYLSGSFFIYIFANQISAKELAKYWVITNIASIVKNLLFVIALYIQANQYLKKPPRNYKLYPSN
ncbi:MAG TPA: hypothetical protein VFQ73_02795 [Flavisolibacter sp.]|nr:hypothetical protein [Flavisolibacter sp.]